jgi:hypothetical protein
MKSEPKIYKLEKLANAYIKKDLRVDPQYQRGTTWSVPQQQLLIDSLLRGYEIPLFYVHLKETANDLTGGVNVTGWLVDGQQRIAAIADYLQNKFALPDDEAEVQKTVNPTLLIAQAPWRGKKFEELGTEHKTDLLNRELRVIEMHEEQNREDEARILFVRLQAGTPLTAQQKRDAWPGNFTTFVIQHAGKDGHPASNPKPFFQLVPRGRKLNIDDGSDHYVDGLADRRKFFAGLAMTIMSRERSEIDFVDLKGKTINEFYVGNLNLAKDDPAALRVIKALDTVPTLPGFHLLLLRRPITHQMAFHFTLLVDSLVSGNYVNAWRNGIIPAFISFLEAVTDARQQHRKTHLPTPYYERFVALLGGSGSDSADVIRRRHGFFLEKLLPGIKIMPRDEKRLFDTLDKEWIYNRDKQTCQCCGEQPVPFRETVIHHVAEHSAGGATVVENGVLVCQKCHADRALMQSRTSQFREHLKQVCQQPSCGN